MPLLRPLLQLCALLLIVFAATAAHAAAPAYGPDEVRITIGHTPSGKTRSHQDKTCQSYGGVLLPMVTEAVYVAAFKHLNSSGFRYAVGYMGASTMLSPETCTTDTKSLDCTWYWDEGRYAGKDNALEFYKGNRNVRDLAGAHMVSALVGNYWGAHAKPADFPGSLMQRYGVAARRGANLGWMDSNGTEWGYDIWGSSWQYTFCGIEQSTSVSPTTTTTTAAPNEGKIMGLSVGAFVGIAAGGAVAVGLIIALVACLACKGCCCCAESTAVAESACAHESCCAASQRGDMSRANSFRSCHSGYGDFSNRSFHDGAASKDGCSRRSSFHGSVGAAEAEMRQNDCEMASVAGSHYSRAASGVHGSWAPPSRTSSQMMMQPQPRVMMPMQPQVMMQPQPPMPMHGNWQM